MKLIHSLLLASFVCLTAPAQTVRFATNLGDIDVTLLPEAAPATVQNFLNYVNKGAYTNNFFHRAVYKDAGGNGISIIQGGGFTWGSGGSTAITQDSPVKNEYKVSNTRGTIAMAKVDGNPNSATSQYFFNIGDNSSSLNSQNGGFTVFGVVADYASLAVLDKLAKVPTYTTSYYADWPLQNFTSGGTPTIDNLVLTKSIAVIDTTATPTISTVISAGDFGAYQTAAAGSYIEIYGRYLSGTFKTWDAAFVLNQAPKSLGYVSVTIDGKPAYIYAISPSQLNVQVPDGVTAGATVPIVVSVVGNTSTATGQIAIRNAAGGLLAPYSFKVDGKQYVTAFHGNSGTYVSNGSILNLPNAPAKPGETLVFYGLGFGPVTPGPVAGVKASGASSTVSQIEFYFGDQKAAVAYSGLTPSYVGLYQFNVVVPSNAPTGDVQLKVTVDGAPIAQSLYIPVSAN